MYKYSAFYAEEVNNEGPRMMHPVNDCENLCKILIFLLYIEMIKIIYVLLPPPLLVKEATKAF